MMKDDVYERVCGILADRETLRNGNRSFEDICSEAGAVRVDVDNLLYERLGMSGEELLEAFRRGKVM